MKKYSVLMTHTATEDLKSIASYIANELREPSIAKKLRLLYSAPMERGSGRR